MIRLTVEQLHELQHSIQETGEINASVYTENAIPSLRRAIAWAKGNSGSILYLATWRNEKSWERAFKEDDTYGDLNVEDDLSQEYTHAYPVNSPVNLQGQTEPVDMEAFHEIAEQVREREERHVQA